MSAASCLIKPFLYLFVQLKRILSMRFILVYCLSVLLCLSVYGQRPEQLLQQNQEILQNLDLTPTQKQKIEDLKIKYADLFSHNIRSTTDRQKRMQKRKLLQRDLRLEMQAILTPSQQRKFRDLMHNKQGQSRGRILMETLASLDLSDDQKEQIRSLLSEQRPQMEEIRNSDKSEEEKKQELRALRENTETALRAILTSEQFQQLQQKLSSGRRFGRQH